MLTRAELARNAERKLAAAGVLVREGFWSEAYYLAGYTVELALKAIIARRFRADEIPDRKLVESVHTHNLARLVELAELGFELDDKQREPEFARRWLIVISWTEGSRYRSIDRLDAERLLDALVHPEHGVVGWLRLHLPEFGSKPAKGS